MKAPKRPKKAKRAADQFDVAMVLQDIKARVLQQLENQKLSMRALSAKAELGNNATRHFLKQAGDVSLINLFKMAKALGTPPGWLITGQHAIYDSETSMPLNVRLLFVFTCHDIEDEFPNVDNGYIAVEGSKYPADSKAMLVESSAMNGEGTNEHIPPEALVISGDVVIFSRSQQAMPGQLVVAQMKAGAVVRKLAESDGGLQLVASNANFARSNVKPSDVLGPVLCVVRKMK